MADLVPLDKTAYDNLTPSLLMPPASLLTAATPAAWFTANAAIYQRFSLLAAGTYRYVNVNVGTASGNLEAGVVALSGTGHLNFTKVMTTGLIAATAGNLHLDCGATLLPAGDYALFFFADNTTITVPNRGPDTSLTAAKLAANATQTSAGVPASGTLPSWSNRTIMGLTLEKDI